MKKELLAGFIMFSIGIFDGNAAPCPSRQEVANVLMKSRLVTLVPGYEEYNIGNFKLLGLSNVNEHPQEISAYLEHFLGKNINITPKPGDYFEESELPNKENDLRLPNMGGEFKTGDTSRFDKTQELKAKYKTVCYYSGKVGAVNFSVIYGEDRIYKRTPEMKVPKSVLLPKIH